MPNNQEQEEAALSVSAPGGWIAKLSGADTKTILVALIFFMGVLVVAYEIDQDRRSDKEARSGFKAMHETTHALLKQVLVNQQAIIDLYRTTTQDRRDDIGEISYILSLPQNKREELRLEMPPTLRKRMADR